MGEELCLVWFGELVGWLVGLKGGEGGGGGGGGKGKGEGGGRGRGRGGFVVIMMLWKIKCRVDSAKLQNDS